MEHTLAILVLLLFTFLMANIMIGASLVSLLKEFRRERIKYRDVLLSAASVKRRRK